MYENLDGVKGLAGWRWLYIICGAMTVPVGLITAYVLPDTPHQTRAFFLSKEEKELGLERVQRAGKAAPVPLNLAKVGKIMRSWSESLVHGNLVELAETNSNFCQGGTYWFSDMWYV